MRTSIFAAAVVTAAAATGFSTGVLAQDTAQDTALTEADVRSFVDAMTEESLRIVESGDWEAIRDWVERHVAETAQIAASGAVVGSGGPTIRYDLVATRENMLMLGGMMMAGPHGLGAIEDFALTSGIENVTLLPNGEAVASVRFHESGAVALPEAAETGEAPSSLSFHSTADCDLRLAGSGEEVRITVMACHVVTTM